MQYHPFGLNQRHTEEIPSMNHACIVLSLMYTCNGTSKALWAGSQQYNRPEQLRSFYKMCYLITKQNKKAAF